jgi:propanol-preferring alcohol dehydrogenase
MYGAKVVCVGIHTSDIPGFAYRLLREERALLSVANLTRQDGIDCFSASTICSSSCRPTVIHYKKPTQPWPTCVMASFKGLPC